MAAPWRTEYHFVWQTVSIETRQHGPAVPVPGFPFCPQTLPSLPLLASLFHTHTHTYTHMHRTLSAFLPLLIRSHQKQPPVETTNKGSYLPLVPALFCQVTSFVSFLLSASLTLLLPLAPSLPLALPLFLWSLALPSLSLPLSLSFGGQACLLGLFPGFFPSEGHSGSFFPPLAWLGAREI